MELKRANATTATPDLITVIGDVLGDLAFLVSDDRHPEPQPATRWMECAISFSGSASGTLHCWCTRDFSVQLAANLLGSNPEDEAVMNGLGDALCEFMNVVCGQFVTTRHGKTLVFNLSIPSVAELDQQPRLNLGSFDGACELSVSGQPFYCAYEQGEVADAGPS